ncbi:MAG: YdeI/OmpD-associated family protein [Myxococcales bacterium]|nr:YdeI/OmpD-associated family protein [Myxococcales bacterium]
MITQIDDFFAQGCGRCGRFATPECSALLWAEGLAMLRQVCLDSGLDETVKWGHPCYTHAGRNIAILGAFRGDFRLSFFNAALLADADGVLERPGPNTRHANMIRFRDVASVEASIALLRTYLTEAKGYAASGVKPPKNTNELEVPAELADAFIADPELAGAFAQLTPGRQRSYLYHLKTAKKSSTRLARIAKARPKILAGKGQNER